MKEFSNVPLRQSIDQSRFIFEEDITLRVIIGEIIQ